jgi:hypothetical protein
MATSPVGRTTSLKRRMLRHEIATLLVFCVILSGDRSRAKTSGTASFSEIKNPAGDDSFSPTVNAGLHGELC